MFFKCPAQASHTKLSDTNQKGKVVSGL